MPKEATETPPIENGGATASRAPKRRRKARSASGIAPPVIITFDDPPPSSSGPSSSAVPPPPAAPSCATGVLRVASSSSSSSSPSDRGAKTKPTLHYWVEDRTAVPGASRYFRDAGYDDVQFAPCPSRELWNRTHRLDAPLQAEAIDREDGGMGSLRRAIGGGGNAGAGARPKKRGAKRKGRAAGGERTKGHVEYEYIFPSTMRSGREAPGEGEEEDPSVCSDDSDAAPVALVDDDQVMTDDTTTSLRDAIKKRDMKVHPLQEHELLLLRSLILDEDDRIRDSVTKLLEGALKDRDMKAAPFEKHERRLLGQMSFKWFQTSEGEGEGEGEGEKKRRPKLPSFPRSHPFEIARVPIIRERSDKAPSCRTAAARKWVSLLPRKSQDDLVASILKEEEEEGPCKKRRIPIGKLKWDAEAECFPDEETEGVRNKRYKCTWINARGKGCEKHCRSFCACNPDRMLCHDCIVKHRAYKMEDMERYGSSTKDDEPGGPCQKRWIPLGKLKWDPDARAFPDQPVGADGKDHQRFKWRYQCGWIGADGKACGKKVRTYCACDPGRILCADCIVKHRACQMEADERARFPAKGAADAPCEKRSIPARKMRWDPEGLCFPEKDGDGTPRHKYTCAGRLVDGVACGKRVRTFCACSPTRILCEDCIIKHWAHVVEDKERSLAA